METATPSEPRRRRTLQLLLQVLVPVVLVAATYGYVRFTDYVGTDPRFCGQCHREQPGYSLWTRSEHRSVVCQECHHASKEDALRMLSSFVAQGMSRPVKREGHTAPVISAACASCHLSHDDRWPQIGKSIGHAVHSHQARIECLRCHSRAIHGFESPADLCIDCHEAKAIRPGEMTEVHCLACHDFLSSRDDLAPARASCLECHGTMERLHSVFPEGAPMEKLPCAACHRPHAAAEERIIPCESCHSAIGDAGLHSLVGHGALPEIPDPVGTPMPCVDCHEAHAWEPHQRTCLSCHEEQVSHYRHRRCWSCHHFGEGQAPWPPEQPHRTSRPRPGGEW